MFADKDELDKMHYWASMVNTIGFDKTSELIDALNGCVSDGLVTDEELDEPQKEVVEGIGEFGIKMLKSWRATGAQNFTGENRRKIEELAYNTLDCFYEVYRKEHNLKFDMKDHTY